jgi:nucleoid-associated protein YgaU
MELVELDRVLVGRQKQVRARMDKLQLMLAKVDRTRLVARRNGALAQARLDAVVADGSYGFHNHVKATILLRQSYMLAKRALKAGRVGAAAVPAGSRVEDAPLVVPPAAGQFKPPGWYVSQTGDHLWGLAKRFYGHGKHLEVIVRTNPEQVPDRVLVPGTRLWLPELNGPYTRPAEGRQRAEIEDGDARALAQR